VDSRSPSRAGETGTNPLGATVFTNPVHKDMER